MKIILISGKAQAGKTTTAYLAKRAIEEKKKLAVVINYGDLLKHICRNYFDWDGQKDELGRRQLQWIGTNYVRSKNPNYWVDFVKNFARLFNDIWDYMIVGDCRFKNEIDWSDFEEKSIHVRICRPNYDNGLSELQKSHPSETDLDDTSSDFCIINDGTISDLDKNIRDIIDFFEET